MTCRVLKGVLERVLADLHQTDDRQDGEDDRAAVGHQGEPRQKQERPANAHELQDPRHREELQDHPKRVEPGEVVRLERADEGLRRAPRGLSLRGGAQQHAVEEVLAGAVDPIEEYDHAPDQEQVLVADQQLERVFPGARDAA